MEQQHIISLTNLMEVSATNAHPRLQFPTITNMDAVLRPYIKSPHYYEQYEKKQKSYISDWEFENGNEEIKNSNVRQEKKGHKKVEIILRCKRSYAPKTMKPAINPFPIPD